MVTFVMLRNLSNEQLLFQFPESHAYFMEDSIMCSLGQEECYWVSGGSLDAV